jgi:L-2,4-diaminobutyrate decarboxylase
MLEIAEYRMNETHPRFFGFNPSPVHETSYLADMLISMLNANAAGWIASSGSAAVEDELLKWFASQAGLPESAGGVFVSGGSQANLTAIVAARDTRLEFEERGRAVVYVSEQTHSSLRRGLGVAGFHPRQIRVVECDEGLLMDVSKLKEAIIADRAAGLVPFMVVGTCGLTNTGGIDPLNDIAEVAQAEKLWFHVDGAYGASILLSKQHRHLANGIGRADSISWDGHKWLFQTFGCGFVLLKNVRYLHNTFVTQGTYLRDADEYDSKVNFFNRGIELTRPMRAWKV